MRTVIAVWTTTAVLAAFVAGVLVGRTLPQMTPGEMVTGYRDMVIPRGYVWERPADPGALWPEGYLDRGHGSVPFETKGKGS